MESSYKNDKVTQVQGYPLALRLCFVDSDLDIQALLPRFYAHSATFPIPICPQAVSGRLSNISAISTQNLGLGTDG